jgi:hypothetical protein
MGEGDPGTVGSAFGRSGWLSKIDQVCQLSPYAEDEWFRHGVFLRFRCPGISAGYRRSERVGILHSPIQATTLVKPGGARA